MKSLNQFLKKLIKAIILAHPDLETEKEFEELFNPPKLPADGTLEKELLDRWMSDKHSLIIKFWEILKLMSIQNSNESFIKENLNYLVGCKSVIEEKSNQPLHLYVDDKLVKHGFKPGPATRLRIHAIIQDMLFFQITSVKQDFEPSFVTDFRNLLNKLIDPESIAYEAKLVKLKPSELDLITKITLTVGTNQVPMFIREGILKEIKELHAFHNPVLDLFQSWTNWSEEKTRVEYANLLLDMSKEIKEVFEFKATGIKKLYKILYKETKKNSRGNKQKVYNFIHDVLQPYVSSFHSEEEFYSKRPKSANDERAYRQHIRDSIEAYLKKK